MEKKPIKENHKASDSSFAKETKIDYHSSPKKISPRQVQTKDFLYKDFKKIADKAPFTISEWSHILHISERTIHRYAKDNSAFNGMQVERIFHIEKLITLGNLLFGKIGFKNWLHFKPFSLEFKKPIDMLNTYEGIQEVIDLLGRMQHGISA